MYPAQKYLSNRNRSVLGLLIDVVLLACPALHTVRRAWSRGGMLLQWTRTRASSKCSGIGENATQQSQLAARGSVTSIAKDVKLKRNQIDDVK